MMKTDFLLPGTAGNPSHLSPSINILVPHMKLGDSHFGKINMSSYELAPLCRNVVYLFSCP